VERPRPEQPKLVGTGAGLLAEAEGGAVDKPAVVQPVPSQHHPAGALVEIRHVEVAVVTAPHDALPTEHGLALEKGTEDRDAPRLNGEKIGKTELVGERVVLLEMLVDGVAADDTRLLVVVEPLLHARLEVVLGRSRALQLGVQNLAQPRRVDDPDRTVHTDREVQRDLGRAETVAQDLLETLRVSNPTLHHVLRQLGRKRIHHRRTEPLRLGVKHGVFSFLYGFRQFLFC